MNKVYLFVDDERVAMFSMRAVPKHNTGIECYWARSYRAAVQYLNLFAELGYEILLDLDHDLGEGKTGYDVAKYVVENQIPLTAFSCHSMNVVGKKNIEQLLTHYGYKMEAM